MNPSIQAIQDYYIAGTAVVRGDVVLSAGVNLWFGVVVRGDLAQIKLGPRVNIQDTSVIHTDYDAPLEIEEGVVVGHAAVVHGRRVGRGFGHYVSRPTGRGGNGRQAALYFRGSHETFEGGSKRGHAVPLLPALHRFG